MSLSSASATSSVVSQRHAIVVGAYGQDGRLLCAELENNHYEVTRIGRTTMSTGKDPAQPFDIRDATAVDELVHTTAPDEIYYLAAHHHSAEERTGDTATLLRESLTVHCLCLVSFLSAIQRVHNTARLFYASSSLVFGYPDEAPQDENTPRHPVCVYGTTKLAGMNICDVYRREHGMFCCSGILFNHESPYRSPQFVTKKIVSGAVNIYLGLQNELILGSLAAQADWGAATDYVAAMRSILALPEPDEFVVATGKLHSVKDFARAAFSALGLEYEKHVREDLSLVQRPIRTIPLVGDASKLKAATGWSLQIGFEAMIQEMVQQELKTRDQAQSTKN
jgi:GDPmannose 4,6-dehydratase